MAVEPRNTIEVFFSYAHEDELLRDELAKHLSLLHIQGLTTYWHDRTIEAGQLWAKEIETHLNAAQIILLLISPDFLSSQYCYTNEMPRAMERYEAGEAMVIPIILRPVEWKGTPFEKLQALPTDGTPVTEWPNRDRALVTIAQGIRAIVEKRIVTSSVHPSFAASSSGQREQVLTFPRVWNVPFSRNPLFTGREEVLKHLRTALTVHKAAAVTQPQAISGLGGIGKTHIAIEYAYRHRSDYRAVLWAKADTRENLVLDFVAIARLLQLPEQEARDQYLVVDAIKQWLQAHHDWLLILDNADDLMMVKDFLTSTGTGHILLTTRAQAMGRIAHGIELDRMEPEEGALFLLHRAALLRPEDHLVKAPAAVSLKAKEIVQVMDGLPLALDQAGAYIEETGCGLSGYLTRYQQRRADLLKWRGGYVLDHPPVATTWSLSFEKVEQANPAAADLLRLCAFLAPDVIPEEIITEGAPELGATLQSMEEDPFSLDVAIKGLLSYSLIRRNAENKTLSIHRLVQAVLKDAMDESTRRQWAERSVRAVNLAFPYVEFATWSRCRRCLAHAQICAELIKQWNMEFPEATSLLRKAGEYLRVHAQYVEAGPLLQRALAIREKILDPDDPDLADSLYDLGSLYQDQNKYAEAETLLQRALAIAEKTLDPDDHNLATRLNILGILYKDQGKYAEAETLLQRALAIAEKRLDPDDPNLATYLNNLGILYQDQSKYAEAETLYQRALAIDEKSLDPDDPDLAADLNNLGSLYQDQSKYAEAEPLYQRALAIREKRLEPDHPALATSLSNLGNNYYGQDKYTEAEPLYQRALAIAEKRLDPDHPDLATYLNNLGSLYQDQSKYAEAEPLYQRALAIREKRLEPDHPALATSLSNLGNNYYGQDKYTEAEPLYQRALAIAEKRLDPDHPDLATYLNNLGSLYQDQSKYAEAEPLLQRASMISEKRLEPDDPDLVNGK